MQNDEPNRPRSRRWIPFAVAFPFLYVLSIGPFFWVARFIDRRHPGAWKILNPAAAPYLPLRWIADYFPWLDHLLRWYTELL